MMQYFFYICIILEKKKNKENRNLHYYSTIMKKIYLLLLPFAMIACSSSNDAEQVKTDPIKIQLSQNELQLVTKGNDFSSKMLCTLCAANKKDNAILSPLSMNYLLAMIANGASTEPLKEILSAMDMGSSSLTDMNDYYKKLTSSLTNADPLIKLSLANAVWVQQNFSINDAFKTGMKSVFNATIDNIDFGQTEAAKNTINSWCDTNTNGMIKKISLDISADLKLVLANATYFKGTWTYPFEKNGTRQQDFTTEAGSKTQVDMMNVEHEFEYGKQSDCEIVKLPYGNTSFSMILILPSEGTDINAITNSLSWSNLQTSSSLLNLSLPKFKVENHWKDFNQTLEALGIKQIFLHGNQLENIAKNLYVSQVTQDVVLEVNEKGTEAAAVSAAGIKVTSVGPSTKPIVVTFNRPFLFAIQENSTGVILFMGKIAKL
jgi:serine protease inhibitor